MIWAARLIERYFDELFYQRSEGATVRRWLAAIPAELTDSRPRLLLARTAMALLSGHVAEAETLSDAAARAHSRTRPMSRTSLRPAGLAACCERACGNGAPSCLPRRAPR